MIHAIISCYHYAYAMFGQRTNRDFKGFDCSFSHASETHNLNEIQNKILRASGAKDSSTFDGNAMTTMSSNSKAKIGETKTKRLAEFSADFHFRMW
jgi:hypothetical protein